jgi:hypothetical protein
MIQDRHVAAVDRIAKGLLSLVPYQNHHGADEGHFGPAVGDVVAVTGNRKRYKASKANGESTGPFERNKERYNNKKGRMAWNRRRNEDTGLQMTTFDSGYCVIRRCARTRANLR